MLVEILLLLFSLAIVFVSAVIGKKYGPEYMIALFASCIVLAAVLGSKLFRIGDLVLDGTIVVFSVTFLLTDILTEFYGKKYAMKAVWSGFIGMLLAIGTIQLTIHLPAADFWQHQDAFVAVLGSSWRIMLASIIAYILTQYFDVWFYLALKKQTRGKYLWLRNNASTMTSQLLNTLIFSSVAFAGIVPLLPLITSSFIVKVGITAMDTPVMYMVRWYYKRE